jgi:hypothetical protein
LIRAADTNIFQPGNVVSCRLSGDATFLTGKPEGLFLARDISPNARVIRAVHGQRSQNDGHVSRHPNRTTRRTRGSESAGKDGKHPMDGDRNAGAVSALKAAIGFRQLPEC